MIEIPTIKLELYQKNKKNFAHELAEALETVGVAQVDGLEQQLVDRLYQEAEEIFEEYLRSYETPRIGVYYRTGDKNHAHESITYGYLPHGKKFPNFEKLVDQIKANLQELHQVLQKSLDLYLHVRDEYPINLSLIFLHKYVWGKKSLLLEDHTDTSLFTLAPSATTEGLEGVINGKWTPIQPELGYTLLFPGDEIEKRSGKKIKALKHRVRSSSSNGQRYSVIARFLSTASPFT